MHRSHRPRRLLLLLATVISAVVPPAFASCGSLDDAVTKATGIEEPWVENAGYVLASITRNAHPQTFTVAPEPEARFDRGLGMELDLPIYTTAQPLGSTAGAFGPFAAGLKGG